MTEQPNDLSVLIADDHKLLLEVLEAYLSRQEDLTIDTAANLPVAIEKIRSRGGYDVVLLDLDMPGMEGLAGLSKAVEANFGKSVMLFSGDLPRSVVQEAMVAGAKGFFPKTLPMRTLGNAIRFVASGETYMPASYLGFEPEDAREQEFLLTPRERHVLRGIYLGKTNKEIGRELSLSDVTIKMHVRSICAKLGARNRTQAAMIAKQKRLV